MDTPRKSRRFAPAIVLFLFGLGGLFRADLGAYRTVDLVRLLGSGACLGAAIVAFVAGRRGARGDGE
jgi:hypothetical protein